MQPYLSDGGRLEAQAFYGKVLGAQVTFMMRYKEALGDQPIPEEWNEKLMHANIQIRDNQIMASYGMNRPLPRTLQSIVLARLGRFCAADRQALQAAAVLG